MKKTRVKMNKPLYLGMSILDISKTVMYKFWYDYFKPKYGDRAKLCYTDTDSFITYIKTEDISSDVKDPKAFIEYLNDMHDVYKNIDDYNPDKENKILIVFDDMIPDMIHNKKIKFNSN